MAELAIKEDVFYILEAGDTKSLFDSEDSAIAALKGIIASKPELDAESVSILVVDTTAEKWAIQSIAWSKIAMALMRS